ncbi:MAG: universal stress protein [Deltaproteobacteria bacterium]|nr:MAG: universal stress protein [Deltaproteobacteria bacterium]
MKDFKKILVPVDLSDTSPKLVPYVVTMARKFDAQVHLLFVARVFDYFVGLDVPYPSIQQFQSEVIKGAEDKLAVFKAELSEQIPRIKSKVANGDIAEEILTYIEAEHIDLLLMATHGRKGIDKVIFGSIAEQMVKTAPVPVFLVNPYKIKNS